VLLKMARGVGDKNGVCSVLAQDIVVASVEKWIGQQNEWPTDIISESDLCSKAVPWLRRLVAGLSPWRPGFDPGSVHVGFCGGQCGTRTGFFWSTSVLPCQIHPTGASLAGKNEENK
jgi:hypothetical protein